MYVVCVVLFCEDYSHTDREYPIVVGKWVRHLGFPDYEECFIENMVDVSIVPYLKHEDLQDIGFVDQKDIDLFFLSIKYYQEYSSAEGMYMLSSMLWTYI